MKRSTAAMVAGVCLLVSACGAAGASTHGVPAPTERVGTVVDFALPPSIADIALTKTDGTTTSLSAYRGKPVMIADYMTLCEDICPMITANTMAMGRALETAGLGDKVSLLEITIDPGRDSLKRMRAYQKLYGSVPRDVTLLRANAADTTALWNYFKIYVHHVKEKKPADTDWLTNKPLTYDVDHSDDLIFLGANGREQFVVDGGPSVNGDIGSVPGRLQDVLSEQGKQDLEHPDPVQDWTVGEGLQVFGWLLNRHIAGATTY